MILTFSACAGCFLLVGRLLQLQASHGIRGDEGRGGAVPSTLQAKGSPGAPVAFSSVSLASSWSLASSQLQARLGAWGTGLPPFGVLSLRTPVVFSRLVDGHSVVSLTSVPWMPVALCSWDSQKGLQTLPGGQTPLQHGNPGVDQAGFIAWARRTGAVNRLGFC